MLDQKAVDKFRLVYEEYYERPLTPTEARVMAQSLVDHYLKMYAVIPEETLRELWREEQAEKALSLELLKRKQIDASQSQTDDVSDVGGGHASPEEVEVESLPSSVALQ